MLPRVRYRHRSCRSTDRTTWGRRGRSCETWRRPLRPALHEPARGRAPNGPGSPWVMPGRAAPDDLVMERMDRTQARRAFGGDHERVLVDPDLAGVLLGAKVHGPTPIAVTPDRRDPDPLPRRDVGRRIPWQTRPHPHAGTSSDEYDLMTRWVPGEGDADLGLSPQCRTQRLRLRPEPIRDIVEALRSRAVRGSPPCGRTLDRDRSGHDALLGPSTGSDDRQ